MNKTSVMIWSLCILLNIALAKVPERDCYMGSPPQCNNSLASDPTCRGIEVTTVDGWKRMDCDYAVYNIPATGRKTKKWLVIHAGGCDTWTEDLGDYFAPELQLNIFGLRPCGGYEDSLCASRHDYDICTALHTHWLFPSLHPTTTPYGFGLNPPALVDIYHTPGANLLFLHEYGDTNTSYNWFSANGCNATSKPLYICVAALDPNYSGKFSAIKRVLERGFNNTPGFPCKLQVVDAKPYGGPADPAVPCTGILREYHDPALVGGDTSGAPNWAWEMPVFMTRAVQLATQMDPHGAVVNAFSTAINIALCKQFNASDGNKCRDDDMMA